MGGMSLRWGAATVKRGPDTAAAAAAAAADAVTASRGSHSAVRDARLREPSQSCLREPSFLFRSCCAPCDRFRDFRLQTSVPCCGSQVAGALDIACPVPSEASSSFLVAPLEPEARKSVFQTLHRFAGMNLWPSMSHGRPQVWTLDVDIATRFRKLGDLSEARGSEGPGGVRAHARIFCSTKNLSKASSTSHWNTVVGTPQRARIHMVRFPRGVGA